MKKISLSFIKSQRDSILENWLEAQAQDDNLREDLISNEELRNQSEEFLDHFINHLIAQNAAGEPAVEFHQTMIDVLSAISLSWAQKGFTPRETGTYILSLKDTMLNVLQKEIKDPIELYRASLMIIRILDRLSIETFEAFIKGREDVILRQTSELDEISTPVIKVWEGILALPVIGTLDSDRTQTVMENLLVKIVETGSEVAILDISGVPTVDSLVAQHLMKTVNATRLMGAECIISGIRPEIAQTIVHLGIDLSSIITKATLASALKAAFTMLSLKVEKRVQRG